MIDIDIKSLNTYEDFEKLCIGLNNIEEFRLKYGVSVYSRFSTLKRVGKINKDSKFPLPKKKASGKQENFEDYETLEQYNEVIKKNNYTCPTDFINDNYKLYGKMVRSGFSKLVTYPDRKRKDIEINSLEELQKFIKDNKITSKTDLDNKYPGIRAKFAKELDLVVFEKCLVESIDEAKFMKELFKYSIDFRYQIKLNSDENYRYDFLINSKYIIEIHGRQHFNPSIVIDAWNKNQDITENDKAKKLYAEKNGLKVIYFTYQKSDYIKFGYFDKVYTNVDILFKDLNIELIEDPDYEEKYNNSVSLEYNENLALNEINSYIRDNNIYTREEIKKSRPDLYWKIVKFNLRKAVDFCSWWSEDMLLEFIKTKNLKSKKEFYSKFGDIYCYFLSKGLIDKYMK